MPKKPRANSKDFKKSVLNVLGANTWVYRCPDCGYAVMVGWSCAYCGYEEGKPDKVPYVDLEELFHV